MKNRKYEAPNKEEKRFGGWLLGNSEYFWFWYYICGSKKMFNVFQKTPPWFLKKVPEGGGLLRDTLCYHVIRYIT